MRKDTAHRGRMKGIRPCEWCANPFEWHPKLRMRFCSNRCAALNRSASQRPSTPIPWEPCPTCGNAFIARNTRTYCSTRCRPSPYLAKGTTLTVPCTQCGKPFTYTASTRPRTICSRQCRKVRPNAIHARKATKARRRAQKRTTQMERFTHLEIFERDKWRCHICRKPVSKRKVAPHPKAPTLDHLVPLSKGGAHTKANVGCACFQCNVRKSNGTIETGEQLLLIG